MRTGGVVMSELPETAPLEVKKNIWLVPIGFILIIVIASLAYWYEKKSVPTPQQSNPTQSNVTQKTAVTPVKLDEITWYPVAKDIADPKIIDSSSNDSSGDNSTLKFYEIGRENQGTFVLAILPPEGMGPDLSLLFEKIGDTYHLLMRHSSLLDDKNQPITDISYPKLLAGVVVDRDRILKSVEYQSTLMISGATISNSFAAFNPVFWQQSQAEGSSKTVYEDHYINMPVAVETKYGNVLRNELGKGDGFHMETFILKRPNFTVDEYQLRPAISADDGVPQVTWNDGMKNKDVYRGDGVGSCGSVSGLAVLNADQVSGLKVTGKTAKGESVYEFTDINNQTVKYFYDSYATDFEKSDTQNHKIVYRTDAISLKEYVAKHAVFAYKDALGRYILFTNTVYGTQAECGKPVIYLYPAKTTAVSVKVDALITKSEPAYGSGWNVVAQPNGKLTMADGTQYSSLFWEGIGHEYPTVRSGVVVAKDKVAETLKTQLVQLGLNDQERSDFLEFWLPKMPTDPFVRLTWFGTAEMDRLAPLTVTPKPDTTIRVFLDFKGLTEPVVLPPQHLVAPRRKGFTLVEWGGLLRTR
jgi:hypothetical protein